MILATLVLNWRKDPVKSFKYRVRAIVVDKNIIYSQRLKNYKEDFYNYIIMQVLKHSEGYIRNASLKFDKRGEKTLRDNLRVYLSRELDNKSKKFFKDLKFIDSKENTLIQLTDMVAGSIFAYYSGKDKKYLEILKGSKRIENIGCLNKNDPASYPNVGLERTPYGDNLETGSL